jgi:hypothetical protein
MSRIGKMPVDVPAKVKVTVQGSVVSAEGPKGKLNLTLPPSTSAKVEGTQVSLSRQGEGAEARAMHGLARALVNGHISTPAAFVAGVRQGCPLAPPSCTSSSRRHSSAASRPAALASLWLAPHSRRPVC